MPLLPVPELLTSSLSGLTAGRLPVAASPTSIADSGFTASGALLDLAAAGTLAIGGTNATGINYGGANTTAHTFLTSGSAAVLSSTAWRPFSSGALTLGDSTHQWGALYIDGGVYLDNAGNIDRTTAGAIRIATGANTTTFTLGNIGLTTLNAGYFQANKDLYPGFDNSATNRLGLPAARWGYVYGLTFKSGDTAIASTNGSDLAIQAQNGGTGTTTGGNVILQPGAKGSTGTTDGVVVINDTAGTQRIKLYSSGSSGQIVQAITNDLYLRDQFNNGIGLSNAVGGGILQVAGANRYYWSSASFRPATTNASTLGTSTAEWSNVYARLLTVSTGTAFGTGLAAFDSDGKLTFPSATGTNGQPTIILNGPGGYNPIRMVGSGGSAALTFQDHAGAIRIFNATNLPAGFPFQFGAFGTTDGWLFDLQKTTTPVVQIAPSYASRTSPLLLLKHSATPGAGADSLQVQDASGNQMFRVDTLGGIMMDSAPATSGSTLQSAAAATFQNHYWNGASSIAYPISFQGIMDSATPAAHLALSLGGVTKYQWDHLGKFTAKAVETQQNSVATATAQYKARDQGGTTRFGVDASGLPSLGSVIHINEGWYGINSTRVTSGHLPGADHFSVVVAGASTGAEWRSDDTTRAVNSTVGVDPGTVAGSSCAVFTTEGVVTPVNETTTMFVWEGSVLCTDYSLGNVNFIVGLFNTLNASHPKGIGFIFRIGTDSQWQYFTDNGTTMNTFPTGFTPTAGRLLRLRMEYFGAGTYKGQKTVNFYVNGSFAGTLAGAAVTGDTAGGLAMGIIAGVTAGTTSPWCCLGQTSFWATTDPSPYSP